MISIIRKTIRRVKKSASNMRFISICVLTVAVSLTAGAVIAASLDKEVVISDEGKEIRINTMENSLNEVMLSNSIEVDLYDYLSHSPDTLLDSEKTNNFVIERAVPVYINADSKIIQIMTYYNTVDELLKCGPIQAGPIDRIKGVPEDGLVRSGLYLHIYRVQEKNVVEKTALSFRVDKRANRTMDEGVEKIVQEGKEGVRAKTFKVVLEDGIQMMKQLISDVVISQPVTQLVEYGTILTHTTARGDFIRYTKVLDMKATAYTASLKDTGKSADHPDFGVCYTGMKARKGVIAVDPKVIPLYSRVYVEVAGSTPDYGYAVAGDIGGAIKGNLIDLYYDDQVYVDTWGCKRVKVYILIE